MKTLLFTLLFSTTTFAQYGKPQLVARYSGIDAYNAPVGLYCFGSEPQATSEGVFLGCQSAEGYHMIRWSPQFEVLGTSENGLFSHPKSVNDKASWYEFSEAGISNLYEFTQGVVKKTELKNLGSIFALIDSFVAIKDGSYVYRLQDETKSLRIWKDQETTNLYSEDIAYIFAPVSSEEGNFVVKTRSESLNENAPDELMVWNGEFKSVLKDRDADPVSKVKSFRHQYAIDGETVALVINDGTSDVMVLVKNNQITEVARAGVDVKEFDFFSPKMRGGVLAFRAVDFEKRKSVYVYSNGQLKKLLTQGDVVMTDKGPARVDYQNQDAVLYGAPGIGPTGDIYQQATLTDIDSPITLLGIGLVKFHKE